MTLMRFAALFALAAIPLLLIRKRNGYEAQVVDTDEIFNFDLSDAE
jgi:hypothetical protein